MVNAYKTMFALAKLVILVTFANLFRALERPQLTQLCVMEEVHVQRQIPVLVLAVIPETNVQPLIALVP